MTHTLTVCRDFLLVQTSEISICSWLRRRFREHQIRNSSVCRLSALHNGRSFEPKLVFSTKSLVFKSETQTSFFGRLPLLLSWLAGDIFLSFRDVNWTYMCAVEAEHTSRCDFCKQALSEQNPFIFQMKLPRTKYLQLKKKIPKDTAIRMIKHNAKKYIKLHLYSELGHLILILAFLLFLTLKHCKGPGDVIFI